MNNDPGAHYRIALNGIEIDPYRIALAYGVTDHMEFSILKKILRGGRSIKDKRQELLDIINAAQRRLEILNENTETE